MIFAQVSVPPQLGGNAFGLGVAITGQGDSIMFSHNGRDEGFVASMRMYPKLGRGLVVMTNGVSGALLTEIARAFAETYGLPSPPRAEQAAAAVDAATLAPLSGDYVVATRTDTIVLRATMKNDDLWFTNTANKRSYRLFPLGGDAFFDVNSAATIWFEREGGAPTGRGRAIRLGRAPTAPTAVRRP
jgi:hypothetical protein